MANIQKRPDGRWRARYRSPDGKERSKHFGRKVDAERWLAATETAKGRGEWVDPVLARTTVGVWAASWLAAQTQLKPSTRFRYEGIIAKQIEPTWGTVPLAQVSPADVSTWLRGLSAAGLAAASVRYAHRVLSLMLKWAVLDGRIARNPAEGVPLPRAASKEKRFLSHAEVERLADGAGPLGTLIYTLAYTGLRWGELAALHVEDLDLMRRRIHVRRAVAEVNGKLIVGTPKSHEQRSVPIPRFLVDLLAEQLAGRAPGDLVFPSPAGSYLAGRNFRRRVFDPAVRVAGLDGLTPHGLRHTAASLAISAGANVRVVQQMLGHSSPSVTLNVYAHLFADDLDTVADRLNEAKIKSGADFLRTKGNIRDHPTILRSSENRL